MDKLGRRAIITCIDRQCASNGEAGIKIARLAVSHCQHEIADMGMEEKLGFDIVYQPGETVFEQAREAEMFPTLEMRWFHRGQIPSQVAAWFERRDATPEDQPPRTDRYLWIAETDSLGIKLREGRIEIKQLQERQGIAHLHDRISGILEAWRKWSFPLAGDSESLLQLPAPTTSWVAVTKDRRLCRYRWSSGGGSGEPEVAPVPSGVFPRLGCNLELAAVRAMDTLWWTICFEAYGPEPALKATLYAVAQHVLAMGIPPALAAVQSWSYPRWLAHLAAQESSPAG